MNDTTPPNTPGSDRATGGPSSPGAQNGPQGIDRFFGWLRGTGIVRGDERWFAGVASGIAAKAGIDPLIVRGVFVVLAVLGGPGILLYLAGWVLLPDTTGRIHLEEVVRGRSSTGVIVTTVLIGALVFLPVLFGLLPGLFVGSWGWNAWGVLPDWLQLVFGILWWALVLPALIVWLIVWLSRGGTRGPGFGPHVGPGLGAHQGRGSAHHQHSHSAEAPRPFTEQGAGAPHASGEPAVGWEQRLTEKTDEWSRKAEQKAQEWEQWGRDYHAAHRLGAGYIAISLALALLAGGGAAALVLGAGGNSDLMLTIGIASAVAVLALSMIVAGIRGRESGWIGFLAFCGVVALALAPFSAVLPEQTEIVPFGDATIRSGDGGIDRGVVTIGGNTTVDLSALSGDAEPRTIEVWLMGGNATVRLPESAPTRVQVNLLAGNVRDMQLTADERRQGGIFLARSIEQHTKGLGGSEVTTVRVRMLGGNVTVEPFSAAREPSSRSEQQERERHDEIERLQQQIEELENAR